MITLAELLSPPSREQIRAELLSRLGSLGFPVTTWSSLSAARILVEVVAWGLADVRAISKAIAEGVLLERSSGAWLTAIAKGFYGLDRLPAGFAEGDVLVTCAEGSGPYTPTSFWVGQQASGESPARRFVATESFTVNPGQTVRVHVKAESPGSAYNLASGQTLYQFTPLPGLTVTNPAGTSGTWLTAIGAEEESDDRLKERCRARWPGLSVVGATEGWYRGVALGATMPDGSPTGVTDALVIPGPGDGTVTVVIATAAGPAPSNVVNAVAARVNTLKPPTDNPTTMSVVAVTVTPAGTIRTRAGYNTISTRAAAATTLASLQASLGIGQQLDLGALYAALRVSGVVDVDLTTPAGDTFVSDFQTIVFNTATILDPANWSEA